GSRVLNASNGRTERIGRLLMMHANHREEIQECFAGDICAGVGLKQTSTGDTLCAPDAPIVLETIEFPAPVIAVAIEPKTKAEQGIEEALGSGVLAGYPMVDVRVELVDGSYHDVDSSEMAFKIAGSMAVQQAARRADPVLLEPVMAVEVVTPEDFLGEVIGDL